MKRPHVHACFGLLAALAGAMTMNEAFRWQRTAAINRVIAAMPQRLRSGDDVVSPADSPEVVLARAVNQARAGENEAAAKTYNTVLLASHAGPAARAALFDLGNLYLRQGLRQAEANAAGSLPLFELAKQRYRDLLKLDPGEWDARLNLEQALRVAPELPSAADEAENEPVDRRKMMAPDLLTPELP